MTDNDHLPLRSGEQPELCLVLGCPVGCRPLTRTVQADADSVTAIVQGRQRTHGSERCGRLTDHDRPRSMDEKWQEGTSGGFAPD